MVDNIFDPGKIVVFRGEGSQCDYRCRTRNYRSIMGEKAGNNRNFENLSTGIENIY